MTFSTAAKLSLALLGVGAKDANVDGMKHDIVLVKHHNFDSVIGGTRPLTVSSVLFYKASAGDQTSIEEYNNVAKKTKKMLRIAAVDCDDSTKLCENEGITEFPTVKLYPKNPQPAFTMPGAVDHEKIIKKLYKLIPDDKIKVATEVADFNEWKKKGNTKPKIVLFAKTDKISATYRGLATDTVFHRTVDFAFVGAAGEAIHSEMNTAKKSLPAMMVITKGKNQWYNAEDKSFIALHDWINLHSESGMGDSVRSPTGEADSSPDDFEFEKVRELHAKTRQELCFKQKNVCAVYLSEGPLSDKAADMIVSFESRFAPKTDRGVKYNWMWLDVSQEAEFKTGLEAQEGRQAEREGRDVESYKYPTMIFVKPPKKKRDEDQLSYIRLAADADVTETSVEALVEKLAGGATYTRAKLPSFAVRSKKKKEKKEEL